jgi:uncharacterized protein
MRILSLPVYDENYVPFSSGPLRASRYNVLLPEDPGAGRGALIFNTLSGAAAELTGPEAGLLGRLAEGDLSLRESLAGLSIINSLYNNGFVVSRNKNEPGRVMAERLYWRTNQEHLDLTIVPTLACNFTCAYCFEKKSPLRLSEKDRRDIVDFCARIIGPQTRSVVLHWYGGEPTLRVDDIRRLSPPILRRVEETGCSFVSEIYTNAWKLDEAVCRVLREECRVTTLMISLDGPKEVHNSMRSGPGGIGDFDVIMERIKLALRYFHVKLRIHCHTRNYGRVEELLGQLHSLGFQTMGGPFGNKLFVHFSKLYDFSSACKHVKEIRIPHQDWGDLQCDYMECAQAFGFSVDWLPKRHMGKYCNSQREYAYVIAPRGYLYKCYRDDFADPRQSVGRISDPEIPRKYVQGEDATDRPECQDCLYLPVCSGFCPLSAWAESPCTHFKGNLERRLLNLWKQPAALS